MELKEVYGHLCYYDTRNPYYVPYLDEDDIREPRHPDCYCDNCFYGHDKLALEILKLKKVKNERIIKRSSRLCF
jgi:hypothetical protein